MHVVYPWRKCNTNDDDEEVLLLPVFVGVTVEIKRRQYFQSAPHYPHSPKRRKNLFLNKVNRNVYLEFSQGFDLKRAREYNRKDSTIWTNILQVMGK